MQILTFTVAGHPYAIPSRTVLEVLPLVPVRPIPLLPDYVPGVFTYRGLLVPLLDLGRRFNAAASDPEARRRLSTRVIVVQFAARAAATTQRGEASAEPLPPVRLGLVADNVVSIQTVAADADAGAVDVGETAFLGRLVRIRGSTVQMIVVEHLLPDDLLTRLVVSAGGDARP